MPRWTSWCTTSVSPSTLALTCGKSSTVSQNARTMNGRYVSEKPSRDPPVLLLRRAGPGRRARSRPRPRCRRAALVAFDRTMCSAVRRRMLSNGTISSPRARRRRGGVLPRRGRRRGGRRRGGGGRRVPGRRGRGACRRGSGGGRGPAPPARRRLPGGGGVEDVVAGDAAALAGPVISAGSSPCSAMSRRTTGDVSWRAGGRGRRSRGAAAPRAAPWAPRPAPPGRRRRRGGWAAQAWRRDRLRGDGAAGSARSRRLRRAAARAPAAARPPRCGVARRHRRRCTARRVPTSAGLALGDEDLGEHARCGRGHLGVDLVGRDLEQRLVGVDVVADLLQPARDRALGDGLAELRHRDVHERPLVVQACRRSTGERQRRLAEQLAERRVGMDRARRPPPGVASQLTAR